MQLCEDDSPNLNKKIWNHPQGEIWQLSANKSDHELICARFTNLESDGSLKQGANVYRLSENEDMTLNSEYSIECKDLSHITWMHNFFTGIKTDYKIMVDKTFGNAVHALKIDIKS